MSPRSTLLRGFLVLVVAVGAAGRAVAELMTALFPDGVPGYDADDGVTVETRLHPEQMPLGVREGAFVVSPRLDESFGYTSNALPGPYRRGSWQLVTAPALGILSDWSQNSFGALFSLQDTRYLALPSQDRLDGSVSVGGRIDNGGDHLTLAAAHLSQHEDRSQVDTIVSDRPVGFQVDDVRASYEVNDGSWRIEPSLDLANWTYDNTTILGVPVSQAYRDRVVLQGGLTTRYEFAPLRSVVFVMRAIGQDYTHTPPGQASPNSVSYQLLGGLDYNEDSIWRWRVLVGGEMRQFASPVYQQQNTLIAEAGVDWAPSGLTNVHLTLSRETGDAAQAGTSGLVYSAARLTIDHEYLRDVLFKASIGLQRADFFQGGQQTGTVAEVGVTWVMNRSMRLSFTYDQTDVRGSGAVGAVPVEGYSRGTALVTLHLAL